MVVSNVSPLNLHRFWHSWWLIPRGVNSVAGSQDDDRFTCASPTFGRVIDTKHSPGWDDSLRCHWIALEKSQIFKKASVRQRFDFWKLEPMKMRDIYEKCGRPTRDYGLAAIHFLNWQIWLDEMRCAILRTRGFPSIMENRSILDKNCCAPWLALLPKPKLSPLRADCSSHFDFFRKVLTGSRADRSAEGNRLWTVELVPWGKCAGEVVAHH